MTAGAAAQTRPSGEPASQPGSGLMLLQEQRSAEAQPPPPRRSQSRARAREQTAENGIQERMQMNDQSSRSLGAVLASQTQAELNPKSSPLSPAAARRALQTV